MATAVISTPIPSVTTQTVGRLQSVARLTVRLVPPRLELPVPDRRLCPKERPCTEPRQLRALTNRSKPPESFAACVVPIAATQQSLHTVLRLAPNQTPLPEPPQVGRAPHEMGHRAACAHMRDLAQKPRLYLFGLRLRAPRRPHLTASSQCIRIDPVVHDVAP